MAVAQAPRRAVGQVVTIIVERINDGTWAGNRFPTTTRIAAELRCAQRTLVAALRHLEQHGVLHKVPLLRTGQRGRGHTWRPTSVKGQWSRDVGSDIEQEIRSGKLTGELPTKMEMGLQRRVSHRVIAEEYQRLKELGLIDFGWSPDLRQQGWWVVAGDPPVRLFHGSKGLAIAAHLVQRMPLWLARDGRGRWWRRVLPSQKTLHQEYRAHVYLVERALEVLVAAGVLERLEGSSPRAYLPRPPLDDGQSHGLEFPPHDTVGSGALVGWIPAQGEPARWAQVPTSDDHPMVLALDDHEAQRRRQRRKPSSA